MIEMCLSDSAIAHTILKVKIIPCLIMREIHAYMISCNTKPIKGSERANITLPWRPKFIINSIILY